MMTERRWVQSADASTTKQIRRGRLKRRRSVTARDEAAPGLSWGRFRFRDPAWFGSALGLIEFNARIEQKSGALWRG